VDSIRKDGTALTFRMSAVNARFMGDINGDRVRGTFNQNGVDVPLVLTRSAGASSGGDDRRGGDRRGGSSGPTDLAGSWAGVLNFPQGTLRIVLNISGKDDDLRATADSPDQNAYGMPVDSMSRSGQRLTFAMPRLNARFEGTIGDGEIRGTFSQNGADVPLRLQKR